MELFLIIILDNFCISRQLKTKFMLKF